ncbi:MAG: signal recognition particle protein, partial [Thalassospira sp.]|nr:signal recognition particle protein [Thalassospira sp.]
KKMGKQGKKGMFGGMPKMDPSMLEGGEMPDLNNLPKGLTGGGGGLPPGLPGLGGGGGLPPGFPGFGKKK